MEKQVEIGGVTSWCQDLARYPGRGFDVIAIVLQSAATTYESEDDLHGAHEGRSAFFGFDSTIVLTFPLAGDDKWSLQCDASSLAELPVHAELIGDSIDVLVPNQYEYGYKLGAYLSLAFPRLRLIGICHTDEPYYYHLLRKYASTVSLTIAVCARSRRQLALHGIESIHLPYGVPDFAAPSGKVVHRSPLFTIGYVGRLCERQKRISRLIRLAELLVACNSPIALLVCGAGDMGNRLRAALTRTEISLIWTGSRTRERMADIYAQLDALVLVSDSEGTPLAMLEAMSAGVVPIVPDIAGASDVIATSNNGLLYPRGDISALAALANAFATEYARPVPVCPISRHIQARDASQPAASASHWAYKATARRTYLLGYSLAAHVRALHNVLLDALAVPDRDPDAARRVLADQRGMRWHASTLQDHSTLDE